MQVPKALTILTKDSSIAEWMDFDLLRNEGIRHVAALSGDVWTDHNLHDPGITILEVLCYALTDLGYRNSLPIEDLLARNPDEISIPGEKDKHFFSAAELLTCNPLTILDFRKMLMNIEGVRNAWLEPAKDETTQLPGVEHHFSEGSDCAKIHPCGKRIQLDGLYKVILELDVFADGKTLWEQDGKLDRILNEVEELLHSHRNLCEDFTDIFVLQDEEIGIRADLDLIPEAVPEDVTLEIMLRLQAFLSPKINYYTLREMLDKGKKMEEIFLGRPLDAGSDATNYGFIDRTELEAIVHRNELHTSDFYREIMQVPGVQAVRSLRLAGWAGDLQQATAQDWRLRLLPRHRPVMSVWRSELGFFKKGNSFPVDKLKVAQRFSHEISALAKTPKPATELDLEQPRATFREDLGSFVSVQREFPLLYRIGEGELPKDAPVERQVQKQQLKGYLLFFDQLLANYLAQLAHLRSLFSMGKNGKLSNDGGTNGVLTTYFSQTLGDTVPELESLVRFAKTESKFFRNGEVTALPADPQALAGFATQEQREMAIRRLIRDFEDGRMRAEVRQDERSGRFHFSIVSASTGQVVFSGNKTFQKATEVTEAAESLLFLGTLEGCYHKTEQQLGNQISYGFELIFTPPAYGDYLRQINENPDAAEDRRTRFLNHLLARFSEEFTDYTLLMYALEGKKRKEEKIIRDKEAFLSDYPDLSRNRGRGMNYHMPAQNEVSGLERRVQSLMGIEPESNIGGLSNFEVSALESLYYAVLQNSRGQVVFESAKGFSKIEDAKTVATKILETAKNCAFYQTKTCEKSGLGSLYLNDKNGNFLARHPLTYESEKKAQDKINCLVKMAAAPEGYRIEAIPTEAGGWFQLLDDSGKPLLHSARRFADLKETRQHWHQLVQLCQQAGQAGFQKEDDGLNVNFSFSVETEKGEPLACHPYWYCTTKGRKAAFNACKNYVAVKNLNYEVVQSTPSFSWMLSEAGETAALLESIPRFESEEQAKANFVYLLEIGKEINNWKDRCREQDGVFGFFVKEDEGYCAAQSPWFKTASERDEAKEKAQNLVTTMNPPSPCLVLLPQTWSFRLLDACGKLALEGGQAYPSEAEAQWAFYQFTETASNPSYYELLKEEGSCRYSFLLPTPHCGPLATHPDWYAGKAEATQAITDLAIMLEENRLRFKLEYSEKSWQPVIQWENSDGWCTTLLKGSQQFDTAAEAEQAANEWVAFIRRDPACLRHSIQDDCHSFKLKLQPDGITLARHPVQYAEAAARDAVLYSACNLFRLSKGWEQHTEQRPKAPADGTGNYGYRLRQKGEIVAQHPAMYISDTKRNTKLLELILLGESGSLPYSDILTAGQSVISQAQSWKFVIQEKPKGRIAGTVWWQSEASFYSERDAQDAFKANFLQIIHQAEDCKNYVVQQEPQSCRWKVMLKAENEHVFAAIPVLFSIEEEAYCAREERIRQAKSYPFFQDCKNWRYRIVEVGTEEDTVLWQSANTYPKLEDADKAFRHFLHLARWHGNYFKKENSCAGRFEIELREVHLESSTRYGTIAQAWEAADEFSRIASKNNSFYRFPDPDNPCCSGFRVSSEKYLLARHSRRYHTAAEREIALHRLFAEGRRNGTGRSHPAPDYCKKKDKIYFSIREGKEVIWRSVENFPYGSQEQPALYAQLYLFGDDTQLPEYRNYYLDLYECARHPDFYKVIREQADVYRLGLQNMEGKLELLSEEECKTEQECRMLAWRLIRLFRRQPILKEEGRYRFQYFSFDENWSPSEAETPETNGIIASGKLLWESVGDYETLGEADAAFGLFERLRSDKANFYRSSESEGRWQGVTITDPAAILAQHPLTYCDEKELEWAEKKTQAVLNAEGFHLIEHILLRPEWEGVKTEYDFVLPCINGESGIPYALKTLTENACGTVLEKQTNDCLLPFADYYSFQASAVLPYWPQRFQLAQFRRFFETTLRRETPAHILLNILWVGPQQMALFEEKYLKWLTAKTTEGGCGKKETQDDFLQFLTKEIRQGPYIQLDAEEAFYEIVLDETVLIK
jgi:hypothetical protein